jgi:GNAT superfamily N-acetyltransferase
MRYSLDYRPGGADRIGGITPCVTISEAVMMEAREAAELAPSLQIRPATADDESILRRLAQRLAETGMPCWRDQAKMMAFYERSIEQIVRSAAQRHHHELVLVAEAAVDGVLGFIHLLGDRSGLTGEPQGYVSALAVAADAEGQGVGKALLAAAEAWARKRGFQHLTLDTFGANVRAREFYAWLGFQEETLKLVKVL